MFRRSHFPDLIRQYEAECLQDTTVEVTQNGSITFTTVKIEGSDRVVMVPVDTTWSKVGEYLDNDADVYLSISRNDGGTWYTSHPNPKVGDEFYESTSRKITVTVKKRKTAPWSNHFWEWLKKQ